MSTWNLEVVAREHVAEARSQACRARKSNSHQHWQEAARVSKIAARVTSRRDRETA